MTDMDRERGNRVQAFLKRALERSVRSVRALLATALRHMWKFVRRHPVAVTAAAGLIALAAMILSHTTRLSHERDRARIEARNAGEVSAFLESLFRGVDANRSSGDSLTVRELLDQGRARAQRELAGQPDVLAELMHTIGNAYQGLGLPEAARSAFQESLDLQRQLHGEKYPGVVSVMADLASIQVETGEVEKGEALARRGVKLARSLGEAGVVSLAECLDVLGWANNLQGRYEESEPCYRESVAIWKQIEGKESPHASIVMNHLALLLHERSRYADADSLFREALATQEKVFGKRHPETSTTRYNYAQLLADEGHLEDSKVMWEEVLATDRALHPDGHPNLASTLSAYGRLLTRLGEYEEAEKLQREALEIRRRFYGARHPDVAYSLGALGRVLYEEGHYRDAEQLYREALGMHIELNGPDHPIVGAVMNDIGLVLYDRGDYAAADTILRESLALQQRVADGEEQNSISVSMTRLAADLAALGRWLEAEALAREGLALTRRAHDDQGTWVASALVELGAIRLQMGAVAEAETLFSAGLERMRSFEPGGPPRPHDSKAILGLGGCRLARGDPAGAETEFRSALDIARRYWRPDHPNTARAETALARALVAMGRVAAADSLFMDAVRIYDAAVLPAQIDRMAAEEGLRDTRHRLRPATSQKKRRSK
jgi:tetratricopeptide (TPR) repeat protein